MSSSSLPPKGPQGSENNLPKVLTPTQDLRPVMSRLQLVLSNSADEIKGLVGDGFCPVECSIDGKSIVDDLHMDHHGDNSHLEGVAVRSYRDHFAARRQDPRFVVTGVADADATFSIASLSGILPHPSREEEFSKAIPPVRQSGTRDLIKLAESVNLLDVNPIGVDINQIPHGDLVKTWIALTSGNNDNTLGLQMGVGFWVALLMGRPDTYKAFTNAAAETEAVRISEAKKDLEERSEVIGDVLFINQSRSWGFDVWYGRKIDAGISESPQGWEHPVVLSLLENDQNVTVGCPNNEVAEALFGPGGLKNVFAKLQPSGWGGRESIGGSPRGVTMTVEQAREACKVLHDLLLP